MNQSRSSVSGGAEVGNVDFDFDFDLSQAFIDDLLGAALINHAPQEPRKASVAVPNLSILGGSNAPGRRYTQEIWDAYKPIIQDLYITQGRPLRETLRLLENDYGFKASEKQLKTKFKQWGFKKNKNVEGGNASQDQGSPGQGHNTEGNSAESLGTLTEGLETGLFTS